MDEPVSAVIPRSTKLSSDNRSRLSPGARHGRHGSKQNACIYLFEFGLVAMLTINILLSKLFNAMVKSNRLQQPRNIILTSLFTDKKEREKKKERERASSNISPSFLSEEQCDNDLPNDVIGNRFHPFQCVGLKGGGNEAMPQQQRNRHSTLRKRTYQNFTHTSGRRSFVTPCTSILLYLLQHGHLFCAPLPRLPFIFDGLPCPNVFHLFLS